MVKEKVKKFMENGVSLKAIASAAEIHYTTLSKWINDERIMNEKNQNKVEIALEYIVKKLENILEA